MPSAEEVIMAIYRSSAPHYYHLIQDGRLTYRRHNVTHAFFGSNPEARQRGRCEAHLARYWYRAVSGEAYQRLRRDGVLSGLNSYGGIATNATYSEQYATNDSEATHVVEFDVIPPLHLHTEFLKLLPRQDVKAEGDGGTFGLGPTGHHKGRCGEMFNDWLRASAITWRLVYVKVPHGLRAPA